MSSDSSAKKKRPFKLTKKAAKAAEAAWNLPAADATAEEVDSWDWNELVTRAHRDRIMVKLLRNIGSANRERLWDCVQSLRPNFTTDSSDRSVEELVTHPVQ